MLKFFLRWVGSLAGLRLCVLCCVIHLMNGNIFECTAKAKGYLYVLC